MWLNQAWEIFLETMYPQTMLEHVQLLQQQHDVDDHDQLRHPDHFQQTADWRNLQKTRHGCLLEQTDH